MFNTSMKRSLAIFSLGLAMAFTSIAGCSAEQSTTENDNVATETAAEAAGVASGGTDTADAVASSEAQAIVVAASDEAQPEETIVVAASDETAEPASEEESAAAVTRPPAPSGPAPYRIGDHYSVLSPAQPTSAEPGKVEITEFFMYSCPHCYNFESFIEKWEPRKAGYVHFVRFPALFNAPARIHARAFYTAKSLDILDETHMPFFRELHVNRRQMTDEGDIAAFFANYGIDEETFRQTYNSFAVDTQMRKAESLGRRYRISSTPTVIVNGKYVIDGDKITSYEQILKIADYLAQKEASGG